MADTAGTMCNAAGALKQHGAARVVSYCTHPVLSGESVDRITGSELDGVFVTDTIPLAAAAVACEKIEQLTLAGLLAESIRRVSKEESISEMFI